MRLEPQMGSAMFGFTALVLAFLSHSLIVIIATISEYAYPAGNAQVGFSAVVLSLKVLVNKPDDHLHGGLNDVGWMEAFVVPFLFPDRAFLFPDRAVIVEIEEEDGLFFVFLQIETKQTVDLFFVFLQRWTEGDDPGRVCTFVCFFFFSEMDGRRRS
jgi:hypothetical protein